MDISVVELKSKLDRGDHFILIDVREPHEHEAYNIGGRLIPIGHLTLAMDDLADYKNEEIVVYCRSGARSGMAKALMQAKGFKNVRNLVGGILLWKETFPA